MGISFLLLLSDFWVKYYYRTDLHINVFSQFILFLYFQFIYILFTYLYIILFIFKVLIALNIALNTKYSICFKGKKKHKKNKFHYPVMTTKEEHIFHVHLHEIYISVLTSSFEYLPSQLSK